MITRATSSRLKGSRSEAFGLFIGRIRRAARDSPRAGTWIDIAIGLAASIFLVLQITRHAMWSDELNAWGIVLDSQSLGSLFHHMHYEGHPGLWHFLLWLASSIDTAPQTMQAVHAVIALGIVWMVALVSPFSRVEKILIMLGYFVLFEYTVVSRNYGIGLLLAVVYAHRRARNPVQIKRNTVLLGLMCNTNVFALILSAALASEYGLCVYRDQRSVKQAIVRLWGPIALLLAFASFSIATLWPANDISWRTTGRPFTNGVAVSEVTAVLVNNLSALVPIDVQAFWYDGTGSVLGDGLLRIIVLATLPILTFVFVRIFRSAPWLLLIPGLTLLGSVAFQLCFYEGSIRHWGVNFIAFFSALWILRAADNRETPWATPLLSLNAAAGLLFVVQHWTVPFSNSGAAADWIKAQGLRDAVIIGTPDTRLAAVAEWLGRPVWFLECNCVDTYLAYSNRRDNFSKAEIPQRLVRALASEPRGPTLYLNTNPATPEQMQAVASQHLVMRERAHFVEGLADKFYIYEISATPASRNPL